MTNWIRTIKAADNEIAGRLDNFSETQKEVFTAALDDGYDFDEAFEKVESGEYHYVEANSEYSLGYNVIEETGGVESLPQDKLVSYFDYDSFGRDLAYDFDYVEDAVDVSLFDDKDVVEYFFGVDGTEEPSQEKINIAREALKNIDEYGSVEIEGITMDADAVEDILNDQYSLRTGYVHNQDADLFFEASTDTELAEMWIESLGGESELGKETLQRYFDYEKYGRDMTLEGYISTNNGYVYLD